MSGVLANPQFVIHSDDNGVAWTNAVKVNSDTTTTGQFFPRIAVDQIRGKVAVSRYDCRADPTNDQATMFYAPVSSDGSLTFSSPNIQLEAGQSNAPWTMDGSCYPVSNFQDCFDYTGLAFYGGNLYAAWADNSN